VSRPGPAALFILAQAAETPPFTSWAQLAIFLVAVGATVTWLWKFLREKRNGPGSPSLQATRSLELLQKTLDAHSLALQALNGTLALMTERLSNVPTKLDLAKAAEENRHALRNMLAAAQLEIVAAVETSKGRRR
jgi:hypothetical protein